MDHLQILLKCRFWFSTSGTGPEILHFQRTPRWWPCWCSKDLTLGSKVFPLSGFSLNKSSHRTVWRLGGSGDPPRTPPPLSKDLHHAGGLLLLVLFSKFSVGEARRKLRRHNLLLSCLQCAPGSLGEAQSCSHTSQGSCESVCGVQVRGHGS